MTRRGRFQLFGSMFSFSKHFCVILVKVCCYFVPIFHINVFSFQFCCNQNPKKPQKFFTAIRKWSIEQECSLRGYYGIWPQFSCNSPILVYGRDFSVHMAVQVLKRKKSYCGFYTYVPVMECNQVALYMRLMWPLDGTKLSVKGKSLLVLKVNCLAQLPVF